MATQIDFRIIDISIDSLVSVLEAVATHTTGDISQIAKFAGLAQSTTAKALTNLQSLGAVIKSESGIYSCNISQIKRGISANETKLHLRKTLITYRPFEAICEGLALNEPLKVATRKACVLLGISDGDEEKLNTLIKWGRDLGVLIESNGSIELSIDVKAIDLLAEETIITKENVESEVKARLYVSSKLGRNVYNFIAENERRLLAEAVLKYLTSPDETIEKSGQALENFLRELASSKGLAKEASKLNGASQLGNLLVGQGLIHSHHQKLIDGISMLRNAKVHNKDKSTLIPWELTSTAAFYSFISTLVTFKSLYEYIQNGRQII